MKPRFGAGIVVSCTAVAACMAFATQASAYTWDLSYSSLDAAGGATVHIQKYGDVVQVCDTASDGLSAYAEVDDVTSGSPKFVYEMHASGYGVCTTHTSPGGYDLIEGHTYRTYVWVGNHAYTNGGSWTNDR